MKKILFATILLALFIATACSSKNPVPDGRYDVFAKCLTEKGAIMYGTEWCPHCKAQKELIGSAFQYVNYVDCDKSRDDCIAAGIKGYPTWKINGTAYEGSQSLYSLGKPTGCLDALK